VCTTCASLKAEKCAVAHCSGQPSFIVCFLAIAAACWTPDLETVVWSADRQRLRRGDAGGAHAAHGGQDPGEDRLLPPGGGARWAARTPQLSDEGVSRTMGGSACSMVGRHAPRQRCHGGGPRWRHQPIGRLVHDQRWTAARQDASGLLDVHACWTAATGKFDIIREAAAPALTSLS